jgi:hypothetical protein
MDEKVKDYILRKLFPSSGLVFEKIVRVKDKGFAFLPFFAIKNVFGL